MRADVGIVGDRIVALGDLSAAEAGSADRGRRPDRRPRLRRHPQPLRLHAPGRPRGRERPVAGRDDRDRRQLRPRLRPDRRPGPIPRVTGNIYGWGEGRPRPRLALGRRLPRRARGRAARDQRRDPGAVRQPAAARGRRRRGARARPRAGGDDARARGRASTRARVGLSTGLEYAAEANARAASCTRSRRSSRAAGGCTRRTRATAACAWSRARDEAIETTRATGARTQVAHILARRGSGGADANERIVEALEGAAADGLPIAWDVHTRLFGITNLSTGAAAGLGRAVGHPCRRRRSERRLELRARRLGPDVRVRGAARRSRTSTGAAWPTRPRLGVRARDLLVEVLRGGGAGGRPAPADGHRLHVRGRRTSSAAVRTSRCAVGSDATTMNLAGRFARPDAAAGVLRGPPGSCGAPSASSHALPLAGGSPAHHVAAGGAGGAGRSGPPRSRARRRTSSSSTRRRSASRTQSARRRLRRASTYVLVNGTGGIRERPRHATRAPGR